MAKQRLNSLLLRAGTAPHLFLLLSFIVYCKDIASSTSEDPTLCGGSASSSKRRLAEESPSHFGELGLEKGEVEFCLRSYKAEFLF